MNILKGLVLSLLGFLLFLSLSLFGLAFTLNGTILNPDFITSELGKLNVSSAAEELSRPQASGEDSSKEFRTALIDTVTKLEPLVKERVGVAIYPVYDYLNGKSQTLDLALTLRGTVLNADFIASVIDEVDISPIAAELLTRQLSEQIPKGAEPIIKGLVSDVITELKPTIKAELTAAADPIADYLLGQRQTLKVVISLLPVREKLKDALSKNLAELSPETVEPLFKKFVVSQITEAVPPQLVHLAEAAVTDQWIKEQTSTAIIPILNYIGGKSRSLEVAISLAPIVNNLKEGLRKEFQKSPPPEVAGLPPAAVGQYFDSYFQGLVSNIPPTFVINESMLGANLPAQIDELSQRATTLIPETFVIDESLIGSEVPAQITQALADAEVALAQAKQYVGYFQLGYKLLIGFMVLLILGIVLISRQIRSITRGLGTTFLTYGAFNYAGILLGNYLTKAQIGQADLPSSLKVWLPQFLKDFTAPLQTFSLILLIGGVVLLIISFLYRPRQA